MPDLEHDAGRSDPSEHVLAEYAWVRRLARSLLGSESDADDVTQEVVAAAMERRPRVEPESGIRRWLDRVTRRQASRLRNGGRRRRIVEAAAAVRAQCDVEDPSDVVDRLQMHRTVTDAVLALPEPYRSVIVARFLDERSITDIATERGTSETNVRQQISRAIRRLREALLEERGPQWRAGLALLACGPDLPVGPLSVPGAAPTATVVVMTTTKLLLVTLLAMAAVALLWWSAGLPRRSGTIATAPDIEPSRIAASAAVEGREDESHADRIAVPVSTGGDAFVLRVVDWAGEPLPQVVVVLAPDRQDMIPADVRLRVTDGEGRVRFAVPRSSGSTAHRLLLAAESRLPEWMPFTVPQAGSETSLPYGGAATAGGVVTPIGSATALGAELHARPRRLHSGPLGRLPAAVTDALASRGVRHLVRGTAAVDPSTGTFEFRGLSEDIDRIPVALAGDAPFVIHPEETVAESAGRGSAWLRVGRTDHVIAVVPVPALRMRAVFDDGTPAAYASADVRPWLVDHEGSGTITTADADGYFTFGMAIDSIPWQRFLDPARQPRVLRVEVHSVSHPRAETCSGFTFEMPVSVRWGDAGEVVLLRLAEQHVLATDRDGAPVRGAVFEGDRFSSPSGDDGRTVVCTQSTARRAFRVGAPGMLVDEYSPLAGTGTAEDPLRFELAPENRVELRLASDELRADDVLLRIEGPEDMFHAAGRSGLPSALHRAAHIGTIRSGGRRRSAAFDDDLTFDLVSVVPGAEITATVLDRRGAEIAKRGIVMPAFGVTEHVRLEPAVGLCCIDGQVLGADGAPVAARLTFGAAQQRGSGIVGARALAGDDGRFRMRLVASAATVDVTAAADGHTLLRTALVLTEGTLTPVFRLQSGHDIVAVLVDPHGNPLDAEIRVADDASGAVAQRQPDLSTELSRLPAHDVTLVAAHAGRTFEMRIDPANVRGPVRIEAPEPARVPIRVPDHVPEDTVLTVAIFGVADDRDHVRLRLHCIDGTWQPSELSIHPGEYVVRCSSSAGGESKETRWTVTENDTRPRWLMR